MPAWKLLGTWGVFEYWLGYDGDVYRRKVSDYNHMQTDSRGTEYPAGVRWEGSLAWFERYVAGRLPV